jgi:hypothetical protein
VALATPGKVAHYVGNWSVATSGTSSSAPLTIRPASGVTNPVLDGNHGKAAGCQTKACDGSVLTIGSNLHVDISGLTIQDGDNTLDYYGGAIQNDTGGTLSVSACTFSKNTATDGGAIDNADAAGTGTLTVSRSTFTANTAAPNGAPVTTYDGGAIDNGDNNGTGTVTVSGSMFTDNTAGHGVAALSPKVFVSYGGGAIDSADNNGHGTLSVSGSTFVGNTTPVLPMGCTAPTTCNAYAESGGGGAIGSGGTLNVSASTFSGNTARFGGAIVGGALLSVSGSTFTGNAAGYGGAIASNPTDYGNAIGNGALRVSASTFSANTAAANGGAIDDGDEPVVVSASTFFANRALGNKKAPGVNAFNAPGDGGAIDNADAGPSTLVVSASTFSANTAKAGGAVNNGVYGAKGVVAAAADIFNGTCHQLAGSTWQDEGYNVGKDASCLKAGTGDVSHGAGHLGPLAHNGGPTETMLPLSGNPAIGVVPLNSNVKLNGTSVTLCPTIDQRGVHSAAGQACNAGAVQSPAA